MANLIVKQLKVLLWKCWILRRRHFISTIFEIFTPLLLTAIVAYIYAQGQTPSPKSLDKADQPKDFGDDFEAGQGSYVGPIIFPNPIINVTRFKNCFDKGRFSTKILYAPKNPFTDDLLNGVRRFCLYDTITMEGFDKPADLNTFLNVLSQNESKTSAPTLGVIFDTKSKNSSEVPTDFKYTIRVIDMQMARLIRRKFPFKFYPGPAKMHPYIRNFAPLQIIINEMYLDKLTESKGLKRKIVPDAVKTYRFPYPRYLDMMKNNIGFSMQDLIAFAIIIGNVVMCPLIVKRITDEKVAKAKEMLRMMGMSDWVFWGSHFLNCFSVMLLHAVFYVTSYCIGYGGDPVMKNSDPVLLLIILCLYNAQAILFCMLISTVFNKPVIAVVVTVILWIVSYGVPFSFLNPIFHEGMDVLGSNPNRGISSILPNMALAWVFSIYNQYESYDRGLGWTNFFRPTNIYGNFTFAIVSLIMIFSSILFMILIWYLDAVWPWQFGVPKPFYFPFTTTYWKSAGRNSTKIKDSEIDGDSNGWKNEKAINFEPDPVDGDIGVSTRNLRKEFGTLGLEKKLAVKDVSLNIYRRQVTVLLGHNGAGKTTTMNMITGIFPPTSGSAIVDGYDVQWQTREARRSIGLCPQENIIYQELTVEEHLILFAVLKGCDSKDLSSEVDNTLKALQLLDKKKAMATSLSGGMKRKLMLGIAMINGTHILILDEPTTGMDPEARRTVWDLLQAIKSERTILLTTHFMEEADVLGDHIAIMSHGTVVCCGSPMFLKKRFGAGYHLRMAKAENFDSVLVEQTIVGHLPHAHIYSEIQSEVIYSLEKHGSSDKRRPSSASTTREIKKFPALFDDLDKHKKNLGIASFGLTITTMEDVFLRVGNEFDAEDVEKFKKGVTNTPDSSTDNLMMKSGGLRVTGIWLSINRFKGLFLKRFHFARRYWPMALFQVALPGVLFAVSLLADYSIRTSLNPEPISLKLNLNDLYGPTEGFFSTSNSTDELLQQLNLYYKKVADKNRMKMDLLNGTDPNYWALNIADRDLDAYIKTNLIGAQISKKDDIVLSPWHNDEATHAMALSINAIYEAMANFELGGRENVSITVNNHPLFRDQAALNFMPIIFGWVVSCFVLIPITVPFIGASYVLFAINENISKAKLLQIMTGLSSLTFWLSNFIFDLLNHTLATVVLFFVFILFDFNKTYIEQYNTSFGLFLMFFFFGFASIPLAYCFSYWLKKPSTGFAVLVIIYLVFGLILNAAMSSLDLMINIVQWDGMSKSTFELLVGFSRLLPAFSMSFGIQKLYRAGSFGQLCRRFETEQKNMLALLCQRIEPGDIFYGCCRSKCEKTDSCFDGVNPLRFDDFGVAPEFLYLVVDAIVFFVLLWLLEGNIQKLWYRYKQRRQNVIKRSNNDEVDPIEDPDVVQERNRIIDLYERRALYEEALGVIELTKNFSRVVAVDHLTFGVHKEECFGLLGVNGAGKTTTFRMLTGDLFLSGGNAFIGNTILCQDLRQFQEKIGYCPQFDALLDLLTGREMLFLFARLRGMPEYSISTNVQHLIEMVDLQKHADKCTQTYSGGNKRKLSLALAIIGNPPVVFLDEPTAGVDPAARRKIWSTLVYIQEKFHCSIILTSHSMEECEALCSRIAIMVNGQFKCLGSTQHLRSKFGQGYTVLIKVKREMIEDVEYMNKLKKQITSLLPSALLKGEHQSLLHYHVTDTSISWSHLFRVMDSVKEQLQLEDYLISDTTLEQIFLSFARSQRQEEQ